MTKKQQIILAREHVIMRGPVGLFLPVFTDLWIFSGRISYLLRRKTI